MPKNNSSEQKIGKLNLDKLLQESTNYSDYKSKMQELFNTSLNEYIQQLNKEAQDLQEITDDFIIRQQTAIHSQLTVGDIKEKFNTYQTTGTIQDGSKEFKTFNAFFNSIINAKTARKHRVHMHNIAKNFIKTPEQFKTTKQELGQKLLRRQKKQAAEKQLLKQLERKCKLLFDHNDASMQSKDYAEYKQLVMQAFTAKLSGYITILSYNEKQKNSQQKIANLPINGVCDIYNKNDGTIHSLEEQTVVIKGAKSVTIKDIQTIFSNFQDNKNTTNASEFIFRGEKYASLGQCLSDIFGKKHAGVRAKIDTLARNFISETEYNKQHKISYHEQRSKVLTKLIREKVICQHQIKQETLAKLKLVANAIKNCLRNNQQQAIGDKTVYIRKFLQEKFAFSEKTKNLYWNKFYTTIAEQVKGNDDIELPAIMNAISETIIDAVIHDKVYSTKNLLETNISKQAHDLKPHSALNSAHKSAPKTRDGYYLNSNIMYKPGPIKYLQLRDYAKYLLPAHKQCSWMESETWKKLAQKAIVLYSSNLNDIKDYVPGHKSKLFSPLELRRRLLTCLRNTYIGNLESGQAIKTKSLIGEEESLLRYGMVTSTVYQYNSGTEVFSKGQCGFDDRYGVADSSMNLDFQVKDIRHAWLCTAGSQVKQGKQDGNIYDQLVYMYADKHQIPSLQEIKNPKNNYTLIDGAGDKYFEKIMTMPFLELTNSFIKGQQENNFLCVELYRKIKEENLLLSLLSCEVQALRISDEYSKKKCYDYNTLYSNIFSGKYKKITAILDARILLNLLQKYKFQHIDQWRPYGILENFGVSKEILSKYVMQSNQKYSSHIKILEADSFVSEKNPDFTKENENIHCINVAGDHSATNSAFEPASSTDGLLSCTAGSLATLIYAPMQSFLNVKHKMLDIPDIPYPKLIPLQYASNKKNNGRKTWGNPFLLQQSNHYEMDLNKETSKITLTNAETNNILLTLHVQEAYQKVIDTTKTTPGMHSEYADPHLYQTASLPQLHNTPNKPIVIVPPVTNNSAKSSTNNLNKL